MDWARHPGQNQAHNLRELLARVRVSDLAYAREGLHHVHVDVEAVAYGAGPGRPPVPAQELEVATVFEDESGKPLWSADPRQMDLTGTVTVELR